MLFCSLYLNLSSQHLFFLVLSLFSIPSNNLISLVFYLFLFYSLYFHHSLSFYLYFFQLSFLSIYLPIFYLTSSFTLSNISSFFPSLPFHLSFFCQFLYLSPILLFLSLPFFIFPPSISISSLSFFTSLSISPHSKLSVTLNSPFPFHLSIFLFFHSPPSPFCLPSPLTRPASVSNHLSVQSSSPSLLSVSPPLTDFTQPGDDSLSLWLMLTQKFLYPICV